MAFSGSFYGFKVHKLNGFTESIVKVVKSAETVTSGDPISLEDDTAITTDAGLAIFGTYQGVDAVTGDGTKTISILVGKDIQYLVDNDNVANTFAASGYGGGKYFDTIGNTGAVGIDTSSASSTEGQVSCVDESPDADDTSIGVFKVNSAETQY